MNNWVAVKDELPKKEGWVITKCEKGIEKRYFNPVLTTRFPKGFSYIEGVLSWRDDTVTHWLKQESKE